MACFTLYPSPLGPLVLVSDGRALTGLWMPAQRFDTAALAEIPDLPLFRDVGRWLDDYFSGTPRMADFPLAPSGTAFRQRVWQLLLTIPYGEATTYGAIARQLGEGMSAQAVGQAVGKNPISIIIPCHRCLGAKGQLTGYAGGLENKKWLLAHEGIPYRP